MRSIWKILKGGGRGIRRTAKGAKKAFKVKHAIGVGAVGTGGGVLGSYVNQYLSENTGCFLYENGTKKCKITNLSCCNRETTTNVPACDHIADPNTCDNYSVEGECCRMCSENHIKNVKCERASTAEAFAAVLSGSIFNMNFKVLKYLIASIVIVFVLVLAVKVKRL